MRRAGWLLRLMFGVLFIGGLWLGPSLYLDLRGVTGTATVLEKHETIDRGRASMDWWRYLDLVVEYRPAAQSLPIRTRIRVDERTYDGLQVKDPVRIRYQPEQWMRDFVLLYPQARLEHQSTLHMFEPLLSPPGVIAALGVLLLVLLALAVGARSRPGRAALLVLAALDASTLLLLMVRPAVLFDTGGPRVTATATVQRMERFTERPLRNARELAQPFDRVLLELVIDGRTVVAVDDIDAESVPGLVMGSRVAVTHPPGKPREARIVGVTRTHEATNWLDVIAQYGLYAGICLSLILAGSLWTRRRSNRRRLPLP